MKIAVVIPAHLASVRFPKKILLNLDGLPMIEHVRRRALLIKDISDVYVSTCDQEIAKTINNYNGKVIFSSSKHKNGTSRVAETINHINCTHVIILQGDEPLIHPKHLNKLVNKIKKFSYEKAFNLTGPINNIKELSKHSFVKCDVVNQKIINCYRIANLKKINKNYKKNIRKILGIIAFKKTFLKKLMLLPSSKTEKKELIEQMRIIENGYSLISVPILLSPPSINEPGEEKIVLEILRNDKEQQKLYKKYHY